MRERIICTAAAASSPSSHCQSPLFSCRRSSSWRHRSLQSPPSPGGLHQTPLIPPIIAGLHLAASAAAAPCRRRFCRHRSISVPLSVQSPSVLPPPGLLPPIHLPVTAGFATVGPSPPTGSPPVRISPHGRVNCYLIFLCGYSASVGPAPSAREALHRDSSHQASLCF